MANPTTNYGFVLPAPTDLVTDLPADFDIALQGVDTRLKALQPGTTLGDLAYSSATANTNLRLGIGTNGQVLAVVAGEPAWANTADQTPLTTKGDLFTFTTADARLAVGANGETLVANSSTATGLSYAENYAAGKNKIINGDFRINQRAFTSNTTSGLYNFDRWTQINTGGSFTVTPQTFTPGAAPVAGYEGNTFLQGITASQSASGDRAVFRQKIESVRTLAGSTATISFFAKAASGTPKIGIEVAQDFGSGGSPSAFNSVPVSAVTISSSFVRYSVTIAIPSLSGKTIGTSADAFDVFFWVSAGADFATRASSIGVQNNTFQIWGVQVEAGSVATAFQTATGTIQGELAACQRYYFRFTGGNGNFAAYGTGLAGSTTQCDVFVQFPTTMRTKPTTLEFSTLALGDGSATAAVSTLTVLRSNELGATLAAGTTGLVQFRPHQLLNNNNSTTAFLGVTAEL